MQHPVLAALVLSFLVSVPLGLSLAAPAAASVLAEASGGLVEYQFDAGTLHDAPDTCAAADAEAEHAFPVVYGDTIDAVLVPGDDEGDHFFVDVTQQMVGGRITVAVGQAMADMQMGTMVHMPDCDGTVFDDGNRPVTRADPIPGAGEVLAYVENLGSGGAVGTAATWPCDATQWEFIVNQAKGIVPDSVHATWTDGTQQDVSLTGSGSGGVGHYVTTKSLGVSLDNVTAVLPEGWEGNFRVGRGPCAVPEGNAVFGPQPTQVGNTISFTPIEAGRHFLEVVLQEHGAPEPSVGTSVPMTCHFCVPQSKSALFAVEYVVSADLQLGGA